MAISSLRFSDSNSDRSPQFIDLTDQYQQKLQLAALERGLLASQAVVSPAYFYDALGSCLFAAICELDEYYPTRTEAAIMETHRTAILRDLGNLEVLVDLGAGNCQKAVQLMRHYPIKQYVAVDVSIDFLRDALQEVQRQFPELSILGVGQNFTNGLRLPESLASGRRLMFYPGSSLGNFDPQAALAFLRSVHQQSAGPDRANQGAGALLIGIDLRKPVELLELAYDDPLGVTAAFNLNLLRHLNRVFGSNFDIREWEHRALFNSELSRIEMHLVARKKTTVVWKNGERRFMQGETIHTESSYKYSVDEFHSLLNRAGYSKTQHWVDEKGWFGVFAAQT